MTGNAELIAGWTDWMRAGGSSGGTVYVKRRYVQRAADVFALERVTRRELTGWLARHDWQPETRKSVQGALRCFFAWCVIEGVREDNPTHGLPKVRVPAPCPRPTPDAAYSAAMSRADDDTRLMVQLAAFVRAAAGGDRGAAHVEP